MTLGSFPWGNDDLASRRKALLATLAAQALLLLLLLLTGFAPQLPLPGEQGIAISFGREDAVNTRPRPAMQRPTPSSPSIPDNPAPQPEESTLTQDFEDAPTLKPKAVRNPTAVAPATREKPAAKEPENHQQVDQSALFPGRPAQESDKEAESDTENRAGTNTPLFPGAAHGGHGGDGKEGTARGNGAQGHGISYNLNGRSALQLPQPDYPKQRGGRVVVKVLVNRNGAVVKAEPGEPGSTTFDQSLLEAAKKAALSTRFDVKSDAPEFQTGSITYIFQLKQ